MEYVFFRHNPLHLSDQQDLSYQAWPLTMLFLLKAQLVKESSPFGTLNYFSFVQDRLELEVTLFLQSSNCESEKTISFSSGKDF